jgi:cyclase
MKSMKVLLFAAIASLPVFGQVDFSGEWAPVFHEDQPERIPGPELGDYLGLPISDAARLRADSWDASLLTLPEHQCKPHPSDYGPRGPANLRIWKEMDPATQQVIAFRTHISWMAPERTIYLDGRPHPPAYAAHTWQGFSTGKWTGNMLTVTTTHLKIGWIRRNGVPRSDRAVLTEHFIRHGDRLTLVSIVDDPVYLTEPFIRSTDFVLDLNQQIEPYPCESVEEIQRPKGVVPHHLPGENPFLSEFANRFKIPELAPRGGAGTMYPEYEAKLNAAAKYTLRDQTSAPRKTPAATADSEVHVLPVSGNVYMLVTPEANSAVQVGKEGVLVVDTPHAKLLMDAIGKLSDKPLRYIVNTSADADHVGGNEALAKEGKTITGGNVASSGAGWGATIVAHENVTARLSDPAPGALKLPAGAWPGDTYLSDSKDLYVNGEAVRILHQPAAHTDGDSLVFFRKSDVIAVGDLFTPDRYPMIDIAHGGTVNGMIDALNRIIDLTVPAEKQEGGTMVIPGHGRLCDEADVVEYRDMLTIVRDRVQAMIKKGATLEQVRAAKPTSDYDPLYGADMDPAKFVDAVYQSLKKP